MYISAVTLLVPVFHFNNAYDMTNFIISSHENGFPDVGSVIIGTFGVVVIVMFCRVYCIL